jgi:pyochelin synthetase
MGGDPAVTTQEFLSSLSERQVELWAEGEELCCRAPSGVLTADLREELGRRKEQILAALRPADELESQPEPAAHDRHEPFPLTDVQQASWIGRSSDPELGGVATHAHLEWDCLGLDLERLQAAWRRLVARHDMLRAVVLPDGRQQALAEVPEYEIRMLDARELSPEALPARLDEVRQELSHQVLDPGRWPLFEVRASLLPGGVVRVHLSLDALIADAWSLRLLMRDWERFYREPDLALPPIGVTFRDCVLAEVARREPEAEAEAEARALEHWRVRAADLPPCPDLPLVVSPAAVTRPRFVRRSRRLDRETWTHLRERAAGRDLTPSALLLAAYAEVLAAWSRRPDLTLNLTTFDRVPSIHPEVGDVVGDFTSVVLAGVRRAGAPTFERRARRVQEQLWEDLDHRKVSGVRVLRELVAARPDERARMPVVFTSLLTARGDALASLRWPGDLVHASIQTPQVWLDHQAYEEGGELVLEWDVVEELFPSGLLDDMLVAYQGLLVRLAAGDEAWREEPLDLLPDWQRREREAANATASPLTGGLLHDGFAAQASWRPAATAVVDGRGRIVTYGELERRSNRLAWRLRELGVVPNRLVAVAMEKGWEQVVAVLAILKAGGAYLPVDPGLPAERRGHLLAAGEVEVVLTQPELVRRLEWPPSVRLEAVVAEESEPDGHDGPPPAAQLPDDLAYVIYTSGSPGLPKGVMITHRAALNTVADVNRRFRAGIADRVLGLSSLSFDLSVHDVFGALAAGAAIVLPEPDAVRDPRRWAELVAGERVTIWSSTPALLSLLVEAAAGRPELAPEALRLVLLSGDWVPLDLIGRARAWAPGAEIVILGGATESSIWSIHHRVGQVDPAWRSIPYGRPLSNQRVHVLDEEMRPSPVWVPGQLHIAGEGLAAGYWRDEERTAASFVAHPVSGERLYRTGDVARYLPGGEIELLGREDTQVEVQGHSVEPGEVEAALEAHESVLSAVVRATGRRGGEQRLVAQVVARECEAQEATGDDATSAGLRAHLLALLPEYMVPDRIELVPELPLTADGRVDRSALPPIAEPAAPAAPPPAGRAPATEVVGHVAGLVARALELSDVDPDADLLAIGASSVDLINLANALESAFGHRLGMEQLFRLTTVRAIAGYYEGCQLDGPQPGPPPTHPTESIREELLLPRSPLRSLDVNPSLRLVSDGREPELVHALRRRTHRTFSPRPVPLHALGRLLRLLCVVESNGEARYLYPSAGALHPVQVYVHVRPGRVEGVASGLCYLHPVDGRLAWLSHQAELDPAIHLVINRPAALAAAFSIFLVGEMAAIAPLHAELALQFATLEAGCMTQLLCAAAPDLGIGLCPVGSVDFEALRGPLGLEPSHVLLHTLLGGALDGDALAAERGQERGQEQRQGRGQEP